VLQNDPPQPADPINIRKEEFPYAFKGSLKSDGPGDGA
jgi:hypothetical protein